MIKAAIDIGTVTTRLLIGELVAGRVVALEHRIIITDLGEGLTKSGVISDAAYTRLLDALLSFRDVIDRTEAGKTLEGGELGAILVTIVATSAMRDARNSREILAGLGKKGFTVEIISGTREAELSFKGTLSGFADLGDNVMSIDVGGGSTEVILGSLESLGSSILFSYSFDIGSRRITEMFLTGDPPLSSQLQDAREWITEQTGALLSTLPEVPKEIIAVAGTATSAITIRDHITTYESALVHGKRLSALELEELISQLSALSLEERRQVPGLHPGRAPVIVGGLITLATILEVLGKDELLVSDTDILQGILLDSLL